MIRRSATRRRWFWILLFVIGVLLVGGLATGWNVVLVELYREVPWAGIIFGSLGFAATLIALILFFVRLLKEMKLTQLQSEFLATVSHELKTPIATLELSADLLKSGGLSEDERQRLWGSHDAELRRLREQVEVLLETARWQSNVIRPERNPIELESWIRSSMERWRGILGSEAILERAGEPLRCQVLADPRLLNLITDNLLDNARKFATGSPHVTLRTGRMSGPLGRERWRFEIQDRGWGFDPKEARKIFRRFVRGRTKAPYAIPGTGLGLFLAASASRAMGIRIEARSSGPGQGATFTLSGRYRPREKAPS